MSGHDWSRIEPMVDVLRRSNRGRPQTADAIARRDQVTAAMRTQLSALGVDVDDAVAAHALIAACIVVQQAARECHHRGEILHEHMDGASAIAAKVAHVVVAFVPEEARR